MGRGDDTGREAGGDAGGDAGGGAGGDGDARWADLVAIMAAAAAGDGGAPIELCTRFGRELRGVVLRLVREQGGHHLDADDVDGLVIDAAFALCDRAAGWDPAHRTPPWTWGRRRLVPLVARAVGQHGPPLDPAAVADGGPGPTAEGPTAAPLDPPALRVLEGLGGREPRADLVLRALREVGADDTRCEVVLRYAIQQHQGDPSPATTVAREVDLQPDNVRQVVSRTRRRLRHLAEHRPEFAALAELPLLAPPARRAA